MAGRRGASPSVLRAMGLSGDERSISIPEIAGEVAYCSVCRARLRFGTDALGRSFEACTDASCMLSRPHQVIPDLSQLKDGDPRDRRAAWCRERRDGAKAAKAAKSAKATKSTTPTFGRVS